MPAANKKSGNTSNTKLGTTKPAMPDDGTRQLLKGGAGILATGILAVILLQLYLGGFSPTGASTNGGWFDLIVALGCIPFGGLLLLLGIAKWLRNRGLARKPQ